MSNIIDLQGQFELLRSLNDVDRETQEFLLKEGIELLASYLAIKDSAIRSSIRGFLAVLAESSEGASK